MSKEKTITTPVASQRELDTPLTLKGGVSFTQGIPASAVIGAGKVIEPAINTADALGLTKMFLTDQELQSLDASMKSEMFRPANIEEVKYPGSEKTFGDIKKEYSQQHPFLSGASELAGAAVPIVAGSFALPTAEIAGATKGVQLANSAAQQGIIGGVLGGSAALDQALINKHQQELNLSGHQLLSNPDVINSAAGGAGAGALLGTVLPVALQKTLEGASGIKNAILNKVIPNKQVSVGEFKSTGDIATAYHSVADSLTQLGQQLEGERKLSLDKIRVLGGQALQNLTGTQKFVEKLIKEGVPQDVANDIGQAAKSGEVHETGNLLNEQNQNTLKKLAQRASDIIKEKGPLRDLQKTLAGDLGRAKGQLRDVSNIALPLTQQAVSQNLPASQTLSVLPNQVKKLLPGEVGQVASKALQDAENLIKQRMLGKAQEVENFRTKIKAITNPTPDYTGDPVQDLYTNSLATQRMLDFHREITNPDTATEFGSKIWKYLNTRLTQAADKYLNLEKARQFGGTITSDLVRAGMPSKPLTALAAHYFPEGINKEAAKFLNHIISYSNAGKDRFISQYWHPLKTLAEKAGVLEGTTLNRVAFDLLDTVDHNVLKPLLETISKDIEGGNLTQAKHTFVKALEEGASSTSNFARVMDSAKDLLSTKTPMTQDFVRLLDKSIDTLTDLWERDKAAGLVEGDMPKRVGAYMKRFWDQPKKLDGEQVIQALKENKYSPMSNNINATHLMERFGKDGYVQNWWKSLEGRVIGGARDHKYEPTLKAITAILNNEDLHPFLHDITKDLAKRITGATPTVIGGKVLNSGLLDAVTGNIIKQALNKVSFGIVNSLQSTLTWANYGSKVFGHAVTESVLHPIKYSKLLNSLGVDIGQGAEDFMKEVGGKIVDPSNILSQRTRESLKDVVANKTNQFTRETASTFFMRGVFLHSTEENNIKLAALSALHDHYKVPLSEVEKMVTKGSEVFKDEAAYIANEAVSRFIFIGNELDKTIAQDTPILKNFVAFERFPASALGVLSNWAIENPTALGRFLTAQYALGGPQAAIPGIFQPQDRIQRESLFAGLNTPLSNIPKQVAGADIGGKINPVSPAPLGSVFDTLKKTADRWSNPKYNAAEQASGLTIFSPFILGESIPEILKQIRTWGSDITKTGAARSAPFAASGRNVTVQDFQTQSFLNTQLPQDKDVALNTFGISGAASDARKIAAIRSTLNTDLFKLNQLVEEEHSGKLDEGGVRNLQGRAKAFAERKAQAISFLASTPDLPSLLEVPQWNRSNAELAKDWVTNSLQNSQKSFYKTSKESLLNQYQHAEEVVKKDPTKRYLIKNLEHTVRHSYVGKGNAFETYADFKDALFDKKWKEKGYDLIFNQK